MSQWESMTVKQLQAELKKRGLATAGKKAELIARLTEDDATAGDSPAAADAAPADDTAAADDAAGDEASMDAAGEEEQHDEEPTVKPDETPAAEEAVVAVTTKIEEPMADDATITVAPASVPTPTPAPTSTEAAASASAPAPSSPAPAHAPAPAPVVAESEKIEAEAEAEDSAPVSKKARTEGSDADADEIITVPPPAAAPAASASAGSDNGPNLSYPSPCIRIDNLLRPFDPSDLSRVLSGFGNLVALTVHPLMIHAHARFASAAEAEVAARGMHGVRYPRQDRRPLSVRFATESEMEAAETEAGRSAPVSATDGAVPEKKVIITSKFNAATAPAPAPAPVRFEQTETKPPLYWGTAEGQPLPPK